MIPSPFSETKVYRWTLFSYADEGTWPPAYTPILVCDTGGTCQVCYFDRASHDFILVLDEAHTKEYDKHVKHVIALCVVNCLVEKKSIKKFDDELYEEFVEAMQSEVSEPIYFDDNFCEVYAWMELPPPPPQISNLNGDQGENEILCFDVLNNLEKAVREAITRATQSPGWGK